MEAVIVALNMATMRVICCLVGTACSVLKILMDG